MSIGSKQCNSSFLPSFVCKSAKVDVFSQTTISESTEVPKRLFIAWPCHCTATSVTGLTLTGLVIRRRQTRAANTEYRTSHSSCIPVFEAASAKADLFSQSDNKNRPIKTKPKLWLFSARDNNIVALTRLTWIYRLCKRRLVHQSKRQIY